MNFFCRIFCKCRKEKELQEWEQTLKVREDGLNKDKALVLEQQDKVNDQLLVIQKFIEGKNRAEEEASQKLREQAERIKKNFPSDINNPLV